MERSYNGWPASPDPSSIGVTPLIIPGHPNACPAGVKAGDVAIVLGYVVAQFHKRVEALGEGCWGYAYRQNRNADNLSCHASGTAVDLNAPRHPNGQAGTFAPAQVKTIHAILAETNHAIRWGGDFTGTRDEMHFEVCVDAAHLHQAALKLTQPVKPPTARDVEDDMAKLITADGKAMYAVTAGTGARPLRGAEMRVLQRLKLLPPAPETVSETELGQLLAGAR